MESIKKRKKKKKIADSTTCGFTNVQANVDAFNHLASGTGDIPGTGMCMGESLGDELTTEFRTVDTDVFIENLKKEGWVEKNSYHIGDCFVRPFFNKDNNVDYYIIVSVINGKGKACKSYFYEDEDENEEKRFEKIKSKSVIDSDGFWTDYTMYFDHVYDKYVFVFGDEDAYRPEDGDFDWECDSEEEAEDWFNGYDGFVDDEIEDETDYSETNESPAEGIETELPDLAEENIIEQEDAGITSLFIDAINQCWSAIDDYHSIIVTLDSLNRHEFDETLQGILEDKNKEVGALQGILELLSPASSQIEQGEQEAQDDISFDEVTESFSSDKNEHEPLTETTKSKKVRNAMFGDKRKELISFGIITAENPMSVALADLENSKRNNMLKRDMRKIRLESPIYDEIEKLKNDGKSKKEISYIIRSSIRDRESKLFKQHMLQYIPIDGMFDNAEHSFFIMNVSLNEMIQFARTYLQKSFWYGESTGDSNFVEISYYARTDEDAEYRKVSTSNVVYDASSLDNYFSKVGNLKFHIFSDIFDDESDFVDVRKVKNEEYLNKSVHGNLIGYGLLEARMKAYGISKEKKSKTISNLLKEDWKSNGKLEDLDSTELVRKAFDNGYSIYSVRDFGGKQLYINIDPGFMFGQKADDLGIWVNVVEIDGDKQKRIFLDSAESEEEAAEKLDNWKNEYISKEG